MYHVKSLSLTFAGNQALLQVMGLTITWNIKADKPPNPITEISITFRKVITSLGPI